MRPPEKAVCFLLKGIIMYRVKLDKRLSLVASFVRKDSIVVDVGTDHAYLPAYLLQNNVCKSAIACDINPMPLKNADETIKQANLEDKIKTVLSNGLENLAENCADDIVIAGMGGELIAQILQKAQWIKNENIKIIVQPMTHAEAVREFFISNGFEIEEEAACRDSKHIYCVISAHYTAKIEQKSAAYLYYGELIKKTDDDSKAFLKKQYDRLLIKYNALASCKSKEANEIKKIIDEFKNVLGDD